jgi:signal transduction histidine kinase/FixJ family two-component response regulator
MRLTPVVAIVAFLVVLLTWLSLRAVDPQAELFDRALTQIDHFATIENALSRDVFSARAGTLRNYDPLVREIVALRGSLDRLRRTAVIDAETAAAVDQLAASVDRQEELVEQFKSDNALLHNSLSFFGRFSARPVSSDLELAISSAAAAILHLTLDTSPAAADEVKGRLDELAKQAGPIDGDSVTPLLAHGRLLHDLLPAVDNTLKAMRAVPQKRDQDALRAMVLVHQLASRTTARQFRRVLYGTSLLLVGFLVYLGLRLRARAKALQRRAALEHVIAGISMRFINSPPHHIDAEIEQALADMGRRVGSDRAYFVRTGAAPRSYVWSKPGRGFPPGWPEQAPGLAARFDPVVDGIVQIPNVDRLPVGENKSACLALGLGGWACATNVSPDGGSFALGFDAVGRPCHITAPNELSLLRMALDTIVYAVGRQAMEKERARLETRLRQARRMEAVGTITSGIAHNFNNILGGILGHSEVIEDRLGSDARLGRNIDAIRRGAERARDLVEQILVFGRRREVQHRPVSVRALVAEAELLLKVSLPAGIELSIHEPSSAAVVSGEPEQLQQVIFNLCNNAAQAMDNAGRIELEAELVELTGARSLSQGELAPGRYVRLAVKDSGRGMDLITLARIFEPFFTTRPTGNGLGLSTVRAIVREHGGRMNITSTPGEGSCFEVWLPGLATAELLGQADATALPLGRGETIFMVADDSARLLRDEEMLAALGYEPVGFTNPEAALAACRARPDRFDALLVAHFGSVKASLELAAALHQAAPGLPIVLETKSAEEIGADSLVMAGITDVVRWPMAAAEIAAALDRCSSLRKRAAKTPSSASRETYSMAR